MNIVAIFLACGVAIIAWLYFWSRHRQQIEIIPETDQHLPDLSLADNGDAVLVSTERGQLIYVNEPARRWLGMNGGNPNLEFIARMANPADSFLELFAREGQSSFQLGKRWVEASSHYVPTGVDRRVIVRMRELTSNNANPAALDLNKAMLVINEIGETVNASMGIEQVLQTLLTIVGKVITIEAGEICLWDEKQQVLRQRGWVGDARYLLALAEAGGVYHLDEGVTGWIARHRRPVLSGSQEDPTAIQPKLSNLAFESIVGVPLLLGDRLIGTFQMFHKARGHFTQADMALLQAISTPMAVAIYNAELYTEQVQRVTDIASLQQIAEEENISETAPVYRALNERIATLLNAEMCGVFLYDPDRKGLVAEPPFHGLPDHVSRSIFIPIPADSPQSDVWESQPYWVSNDIVDEPLAEALGLRPLIEVAGIHNSALIPMQIGGQRIGVIAVSNKRTEGGFTARDIQNMRVLASQAAIVVENIRLFQREKRLDTELVGLQEITHAIGALSHESEFYSEITERIARLTEIEMCGILLYDEHEHALISRLPFYGVPDELVTAYRIDVSPGTIMHDLWNEEDYLFINNVPTDTLVFEAGLDELAEKIGVKKTLMTVLSAGGRRLGIVQVSNKLNGQDFTANDARLLMIFATQAAAIIENARLYREVQRSADQAQRLRRVAEIAGSVLTTEETFTPVLAEIAKLTDSTLVFINVLDQQQGKVITYPRWVYGIELHEPIVQDIFTAGFEHSVAISRQPFMSNDVLNEPHVLPGYRTLASRFSITKAIVVPLYIGERSLGELGVANRQKGGYSEDDLEVMSAVSAQIATALDRLLLYEQTDKNLERRLQELDAISEVSNELTLTLDLDRVLEVIRHEAAKATRATGSTIVMLRPAHEWHKPNQPEADRRIGETGVFRGLADIELEAISRGADNVIINDYEGHFLAAMPTTARAAVAAAILYIDQIVGVIHLYHTEPNHFDHQAATFLMTLATKASLGYGNASRYQETIARSEGFRRRVDQLNQIFELGHILQTNTEPAYILEAIAYSVQQSSGFDTVLMLLLDEENRVLRRTAQAGLPIDKFYNTQDDVLPLEATEKLFNDEFRISESYFFPIEKVAKWHFEGAQALSTAFVGNRTIEPRGKNSWRDGDMLVVKLISAGGNLQGLMSLDRPHNNERPDRAVVEVLEIFARLAATSIENTRLYRTSIRSAEQEAQLNEVMEAIARTLDIDQIIEALANGTLRLLPYSRMNIAILNPGQHRFDILRINVSADQSLQIVEDQRNSLDRTALGRSFRDDADYLYYAGDPEVAHFEDLQVWHKQGEKTSLILPLTTGGRVLGAAHIGSDLVNAYGFVEYRPLLKRMAQLVASAIQNAHLFDQAINLQAENRSVLMSIQQGIVVLDKSGRIISINDFMHKHFGWGNEAIREDLFDYRPYLTTILADSLRNVLETGAHAEIINQSIVEPDKRQYIGNFYIYPLRAEDNIRGAVLLVEDATERFQLERAIESRASQLSALTEASSRITSSLEREEVIDLALREMGGIIPYDTMTIWRRHGSLMTLEGAAGATTDQLLPYETQVAFGQYEPVRQVVETQRVVHISGAQQPETALPGAEAAQSWMGVPLVNQGHVIGLMVLVREAPGAYEALSEQQIAYTFASQVAIALANADLFEQTFDRTNELGILLEAAQATSQTRDLNEVFRTVVELLFSALDMDDCAIMLWKEVENEVEVQVDMNRYGDANRITPKGTVYNLAEYPAKRDVLYNRDVVVVTVDDANTPYSEELEALRANGDLVRMIIPLAVGDQVIGLIQLEQTTGERFVTQQKIRLARALGSQVAIAIDNARLSNETNAQYEELLLINDLSRLIAGTLDIDAMLRIVREQVPPLTKARELYLALYDEETQEITFPLAVRDGQDIDIPPRSLTNDEVSFVIRHRQPLSLGADYYSPDEMRRNLGIINNEGDIQSYMGVPLLAGIQVLGVLAIRDRQRKRAFTITERRILETVGAQLGAAIQNIRLFDQVRNLNDDLERRIEERTIQLEQERDRIDTLYQITSELASTLDMDRLLARALGMVAKAVSADDGAIMGIDPLTDTLYSQAVLNPQLMQISADGERAHHPAEALATWLIENDHDIIIDDLHKVDFWDSSAPGAKEWRSALAVLLETNEDIQGVMVLLSRKPRAFVEDQLRLLVAAANQVASAINNADLYQLIRDQAERLGTLLRAEQEEAEKSHAILEGIADGVILSDADGVVILFNSAAERILQIPREQVLGQQLSKLTGLYGGAASAWVDAIQGWANRDWSSASQSEIGEFADERLELGERYVSVHLSPVHIGENFLGTVSVFRDITKDVEVDRIKSEFVSNVSHELRTPLTPIKGYTDLLLAGAIGVISEPQNEALRKIKDNVDRLTVLVEDVLDISKIDSGKVRLRPKPVEIAEIIEPVLKRVKTRHHDKKMIVSINIDTDFPVIQADPDKLTEIISNIVDNAFSYTPAGGTIDISAALQDERNVLIAVKDTGLGIPEDFREAIWRRFERYEEHALMMDVAGTGLGLPIVKELVSMHHGDVWFESELGEGTTFYIRLPINQPEHLTITKEMARVDTEEE